MSPTPKGGTGGRAFARSNSIPQSHRIDINRLVSALKPGESYTYEYDRFGNRWHQNGPHTFSASFSQGNNRMDGYSYDAAGNLLNDGQHSYTYDAENRILSVDAGSVQYVYDAAGRRIRKTVSGVSTDYLYDLGGHVVAEVNASGAWTRIEVYAGRHVATYKDGPSGQTYFPHVDWLGTERMRTNKDGVEAERCTNLPFGDWESCTGTSVSPIHFTGKERDSETDLDNFGARYYVSRHGRWLTPDWSARQEAVPYASLGAPQTLNLYAYVGNNPVSTADPDGHFVDLLADIVSVTYSASAVIADVITGSDQLNTDLKALGGDIIGAAIPGLTGVGASIRAAKALERARQLEKAVELGKQGEKAAEIIKNTKRIESLTGTAKFRVPDEITKAGIREVKNVKELSLTNQIKDLVLAAQKQGQQLTLTIRKDTKLSKPLQELVDSGKIKVEYLK